MADRLTPEQRKRNMKNVKSKDTGIEVSVRHFLFHAGFRYRKNVKALPGCPDIVLAKYKTVIFINGCFWHMHRNCKKSSIPEHRHDWWKRKLISNVVNDKLHRDKLEASGWRVITVWQCELETDFDGVMHRLMDILKGKN